VYAPSTPTGRHSVRPSCRPNNAFALASRLSDGHVPAQADVAEPVDAGDLKSSAPWACGFESRRPHHRRGSGERPSRGPVAAVKADWIEEFGAQPIPNLPAHLRVNRADARNIE
jgi:hypothetical protein